MDKTEPKPFRSLGPGMTMPVVAGEKYGITDDNGETLEIEGRDDPAVLDFVRAFDTWYTVLRQFDDPNELVTRTAWADVLKKFDDLPIRVRIELPSGRGGIYVPGT
jgi:hypothetical protein